MYFAPELLPHVFRNVVCKSPNRITVNKAWIGDVIAIIRHMPAVAHHVDDGGFSALDAEELLGALDPARVVT